jgi:hypothetical protein
MTDQMNGKLFDTQQIELSPDGKTLTMATSIPGQSKPNLMVFDREWLASTRRAKLTSPARGLALPDRW